MPWDIAFSASEVDRLAWAIIFGELEGGIWDWEAMDWKPRK